jgi:heat shock protein HslJ
VKHAKFVFKHRKLALLMGISLALTACANGYSDQPSSQPSTQAPNMTSDNSRTSLDWPGVYQGLIPCADCESIQTRITLHKDGTFTRSMIYQGKPDGQFNDQGKFSWDEGGGKITLIDKQGQSQSYLVGEGRLFHLDQQGQRISGELANRYILIKNPADAQLENKRWVLSELMGQAVTSKPGQKAAFVQFDNENARVSGNSSCNNFFGGYELQEGNRISFGQLGSTMMACPDMSTEAKFLQVLQKVDNYAVKDDTLSLHKARMAPLARFKWVVEQK